MMACGGLSGGSGGLQPCGVVELEVLGREPSVVAPNVSLWRCQVTPGGLVAPTDLAEHHDAVARYDELVHVGPDHLPAAGEPIEIGPHAGLAGGRRGELRLRRTGGERAELRALVHQHQPSLDTAALAVAPGLVCSPQLVLKPVRHGVLSPCSENYLSETTAAIHVAMIACSLRPSRALAAGVRGGSAR